ncbi:glycoside hydrolase family 1 protein [Mesoplasma florum]|uniref:glycoside hydrolase family 1 protein n=1 Tax=Mesoplasma florum TaxID=2151 RepID=UPI000D08BE48|nr:glycoside hydrolase family 1 protein [Mesoplasma florum]AVN61301.1 6-phospho-beta-glucosidase [Mesoplasma florum]
MKIKFSNDFWWGTAISGPQSEGSFEKKNDSIMDYWFKQNKEDFYNFVGPSVASDMFNQYENDIKIMASLKLNSYRTSIQWTRLVKNIMTGEIDEKAVEFYRDYFTKLKEKGIVTIVNLFHFDMPIELENIGGWTNKKTVKLYAQYAENCFKLFGDIISHWATFNEPVVPIEGCYLYKWYYPKIVDFKKGIQAGYNTILAHAKAVNIFHKIFENDKSKKICSILNLTPAYPKDNKPENIEAAEIRDLIFNKSFLDTMIKGEFPSKLVKLFASEDLLPEYDSEELAEIKKSYIDFLGVNYYQPSRIQSRLTKWNDKKEIMPEKWFENYEWPEKRINPHRGWEIHPKTLYKIAIDIRDNYNNIPWIVSENGMGVENEDKFLNKENQIQDDYRIDFIKEHLYWLNKAIDEGSNCFGYHLWTFIDCWSWGNAYKNRYGIVSLDLLNNKRKIKKSGYWLKEVIENSNEIEIDEDLVK